MNTNDLLFVRRPIRIGNYLLEWAIVFSKLVVCFWLYYYHWFISSAYRRLGYFPNLAPHRSTGVLYISHYLVICFFSKKWISFSCFFYKLIWYQIHLGSWVHEQSSLLFCFRWSWLSWFYPTSWPSSSLPLPFDCQLTAFITLIFVATFSQIFCSFSSYCHIFHSLSTMSETLKPINTTSIAAPLELIIIA